MELPTTPQPPAQVFLAGIGLGARHFGKLFLFTTLTGFLGLLPTLYMASELGDATLTPPLRLGLLTGRWLGVECAAVVISLLVQTFLILRLDHLARRESAAFPADWRRALRALLPLIVASIICGIALFIGYLLLIVPGVILTVTLIFFQFEVVLERTGPIQALNRSHTLVWGNWWRTFGVLIMMLVVLIVIAVVLGAIAGGLWHLNDPATSARDLIGQGVEGMVLTAVLGPFGIAVLYAQYQDLKLRRTLADSAPPTAAIHA